MDVLRELCQTLPLFYFDRDLAGKVFPCILCALAIFWRNRKLNHHHRERGSLRQERPLAKVGGGKQKTLSSNCEAVNKCHQLLVHERYCGNVDS